MIHAYLVIDCMKQYSGLCVAYMWQTTGRISSLNTFVVNLLPGIVQEESQQLCFSPLGDGGCSMMYIHRL